MQPTLTMIVFLVGALALVGFVLGVLALALPVKNNSFRDEVIVLVQIPETEALKVKAGDVVQGHTMYQGDVFMYHTPEAWVLYRVGQTCSVRVDLSKLRNVRALGQNTRIDHIDKPTFGHRLSQRNSIPESAIVLQSNAVAVLSANSWYYATGTTMASVNWEDWFTHGAHTLVTKENGNQVSLITFFLDMRGTINGPNVRFVTYLWESQHHVAVEGIIHSVTPPTNANYKLTVSDDFTSITVTNFTGTGGVLNGAFMPFLVSMYVTNYNPTFDR